MAISMAQEHQEYLRNHQWAVLATGRTDSPGVQGVFRQSGFEVTDDLLNTLDEHRRTVFRIKPDKVLIEGFEPVDE